MADIGSLPQLLPTLLIEAWLLSWIWSSQVQLVWLDKVFWQIPDFAFWCMWRTSCLFGICRMLEIYTEFCIIWGAVYIPSPIPSPKSPKFCISSAPKHGSCFNFYLFLFLYVCAGGHGGQKSQKSKIKFKKSIGSLGDGVTGVYELPPQAGARNWISAFLPEQRVLLSAKLHLQPPLKHVSNTCKTRCFKLQDGKLLCLMWAFFPGCQLKFGTLVCSFHIINANPNPSLYLQNCTKNKIWHMSTSIFWILMFLLSSRDQINSCTTWPL